MRIFLGINLAYHLIAWYGGNSWVFPLILLLLIIFYEEIRGILGNG